MTEGLLDDAQASALDTPAVVVDLDRMDARIASMAALMRERGIALRPHAKTHKSIEVARRQIEAGAVGLTVATIGEAEVFADAGFTDLFIAYPLIAGGPKADRLRRLASRCVALGRGGFDRGGRSAGGRDEGCDRPLCASSSRSTAAGRGPASAPSWRGRSLDMPATVGSRWSGRSPTRATATGGRNSARRPAEDAVSSLDAAAASLRAEGIEPMVLSAGATPTFELSAHGIVTEERPGTYVFGDRQQAALRGEPAEDVALMVAATVVSAGTGDGFVIDAGAKSLAQDVSPIIPGHGAIVGYPEAVIHRLHDHHGAVSLPPGSARPAVGSIVWVVPNHVCPVINLVDDFVVAQGGRVVARWTVDARGRNA